MIAVAFPSTRSKTRLLAGLWLVLGCQGQSADDSPAIFGGSQPAVHTGGAATGAFGGGASSGAKADSAGGDVRGGSAALAAGASGSAGSAGRETLVTGGTRSASSGGARAVDGGTASGGAAGSPADPSPRACSDKPGSLVGTSTQTLTAAGLQRTFVYYAPPDLDPAMPAPLVIAAHGWTMTGQQMGDLTHYQALADREGFVVAFPDGQPLSVGPWNVGESACPSSLLVLPLGPGDDQAFIDAMVAFAEADRCIDRRHVFVTGFSMGGYFTNETGCLRSDIAGIAPHSGGSHDLTACPAERKPVILFHGTSDWLIPVSCGQEARDRWVRHNGCTAEVDSVPVRGGHCEYSKGCPADAQVALCLFDGMDHGWAGGEGTYGFPDYEPATELSWAFFREYAWD